MLPDFGRKIVQIIRNDRVLGRITSVDDLGKRTGHEPDEIEKAIEKIKKTPTDGGIPR